MTPRGLLARGAAALTAACALVLLAPAGVSAHPLGNFTVNRYDGLIAAPGRLSVDHVEDLAEIPATQAGPDVERLGPAEWARRRCERAALDSRLTVDGRGVALTARHSGVRVRPGQAGLDTLRLECRFTAPLPDSGPVSVAFRAAGASAGPGWREITARGDRTTLTASDVPEESASRELTRYPQESLSSPADTASASLRVRPGGPALDRDRQDAPAASVLPRGADRWTRALDSLVARRHLTLGFAALALVVAVALGAGHALAPGHGKTLMAATAAARGGGARLKDVLPMAASVTVTHTLGVVALGVLVTAGSAATPSVVAWLGVAGGALVTLAGASLVRRALRNRAHGRTHAHHHDHGHSHDHPHEHGPHTHTHPVSPTLRGTILLGFAGGLVPSPSAVVVLVGAAAVGHAWFGLLLVVAYGLGLALTLTAAGVAVVRLGGGVSRLLTRRPRWTSGPLAGMVRRATPLGSACVVVLLGAGLVFRGAASALG
ncbi:sulfite exporter TauE/SafE family protein [Streptomyces sp. NPDC000349]|uniref:sulfite exporter TauE/SafE family protein n=1 Tax=unclassified Streptomyces TaxID=2593676 RepID=UPI002785BE7D|nr:sulfite exporter TauE/SafE family protein [Streptomyces sp. DSM 40167]MDQ0402917.1 ABC-type nickel/cobalt efflux system permease component RcnA [Streptomyces sp. DSM 40167]